MMVLGGFAALAGCNGESSVETPAEAGEEESVAASPAARQQATCVTIRRGVFSNVQDAFLSGDSPTWATGTDWGLWTGKSSGGNENRALLRADLSFLSEYTIIVSATLMINQSWSESPGPIRVHRVTQPWSEATVTRQSFGAGGFDPLIEGSLGGIANGFVSIDLTPLVSDWVRGVHPNYGVLLEESPVNAHYFYSSEVSVSNRPALAVCYRNGPKPHRGGALVAGGVTSDSEGYHFIGSLSQGPGANRVSTSENHRFIGGLVGATQP
jgi:hypothetical protein